MLIRQLHNMIGQIIWPLKSFIMQLSISPCPQTMTSLTNGLSIHLIDLTTLKIQVQMNQNFKIYMDEIIYNIIKYHLCSYLHRLWQSLNVHAKLFPMYYHNTNT